jgi:hypothetical protein
VRTFGRVLSAVVIALSMLVAAPGALADATPVTTTNLGMGTGFGVFAVDSAHGHVFVSEPKAGAVVELDAQGQLLTTISGLPGATGLTIGDGYLYVAVQTAGTIPPAPRAVHPRSPFRHARTVTVTTSPSAACAARAEPTG